MYHIYDYDSMQTWLLPFLDCTKVSQSTTNNMRKTDATKLALVTAHILASLQVASESLIKALFLGCKSNATNSRLSDIKSLYEKTLCNLLEIAVNHDGASTEVIRASLVYLFYLKNEGQHEEEKVAKLMETICKMVKESQLYLDPPSCLPEAERESRRKLFWTFYIMKESLVHRLEFPSQSGKRTSPLGR